MKIEAIVVFSMIFFIIGLFIGLITGSIHADINNNVDLFCQDQGYDFGLMNSIRDTLECFNKNETVELHEKYYVQWEEQRLQE